MMLNIQNLIDDAKCYDTIRELRWPEGVRCVHCHAAAVTKRRCCGPTAAFRRRACRCT
ncbi:MAG: hypothetical protein KFB96_04830 [Thiocapsa sp.]|uniref:hypothetical protein n=1 Tax=Thiocapsa sp. TaxID=2024551 RepID=UPI001BD0AB9B|nr:hypothetical protein [Thiocapsa sp.]QVL49818.1 MAG: hypothetical protein KFB96_04830 [Thiocapsa sp.]